MVQLQRDSGLQFTQFSQALGAALENGLIEVTGAPGQEMARLTTLGEQALAASP